MPHFCHALDPFHSWLLFVANLGGATAATACPLPHHHSLWSGAPVAH